MWSYVLVFQINKLTTFLVSERFADNIRAHPKFVSGEWDEAQTLRNFLDTFDDPDNPDGTVTWEEFLNYYSGVSVMYEDDEYFDLLMRNMYGLEQKGANRKTKKWKEQICIW